jgi:hypothetical protein
MTDENVNQSRTTIHFKQSGRFVTFAIAILIVVNTINKSFYYKTRIQFIKVRVITGP